MQALRCGVFALYLLAAGSIAAAEDSVASVAIDADAAGVWGSPLDEPSPGVVPIPEVGAELASAARVEALEARISELEAALSASREPSPAPDSDKSRMTTRWGANGFTAASADEAFLFHAGGRVQLDAVALNTDDLVLGGVGAADAVNFRRARFRMDGTMYRTMDWATEFDFVNGFDVDPGNGPVPVTGLGGDVAPTIAPTDLWWMFREVPWVGNVRIGNQKEPIGLEHLNSSRFLDFMERSFLQDAFFGPFNNGFTPGVSLQNWNPAETYTWSLGGYKNTQNIFGYDTGDNEYALTGRIAVIAYAADDDRRLVHLAIATSYRGFDQDVDPAIGNVRVRSRASLRNGPPSGLNPNLADTNFAGRLFVENQTLLAPEIAVVAGPWLWQAEYVGGFHNGTVFTPLGGAAAPVGQVFFQGSYVQALYFLTGEHRVYERHDGRFGRVVPNRNASVRPGGCGFDGFGAWQVGARYGFLDLTDAGIDGGYIQDFTLGLNWFLNPHSKLQFNYILQLVDNTLRDAAGSITAENDGELHGFGVRFAHDF